MPKQNYKAYVQVYDETFYLDTVTGEGIAPILAKLDPLICKFANSTYFPGSGFEDIKSELTILAMEGIYAFEPDRNVKLSTFMQTHLHNKIISKIKSKNKMSNDAFGLSDKNPEESKLKKARGELFFSQCNSLNKNSDNRSEDALIPFENTISNDSAMYSTGVSDYEIIDFEASLIKISSRLDPLTRKIIELIYFEDYSIQDAASAVGITGWAASMRLKKLASRGTFRSIFEQDDWKKLENISEYSP